MELARQTKKTLASDAEAPAQSRHSTKYMDLDEAHGLLAVGGLGDDLVARLGEGFDNIEADERLVLCDDDAATAGGGGLRGRGLFAHDSHISMLRADALAVAAPP